MRTNLFVEKLAAIEHERWAKWQEYVHSKCKPHIEPFGLHRDDGLADLLIPAELVKHWERQIETKYEDLTEDEKQSDRNEVFRYLKIVIEEIVSVVINKTKPSNDQMELVRKLRNIYKCL